MTDQTHRDDLVERLRAKVVTGWKDDHQTPITRRRNPDGPEAADRIERLERALRLAKLAILTWSPCPNETIQEIDDAALKGQD